MSLSSTREAFQIGDLAASIVDPWAWWRAALANPKEIGRSLPVHDGEPNTGFFRVRYAKDKAFEPVAIWMENGQWLAYRSGREVSARDIWVSCCRHPVEYQAYNDAMDGKGWPDDDQVVAKQVQPPAPGDNSGAVDRAETLADQIESALKGKGAYAKITDDETAAKALSLRNRLNELSNQADKVREEEKKPHLLAGKAVDARWQPLVKKAKTGADEVKAAISAWETEKLRKSREEARRREEEAQWANAAPEAEIASVDSTVAAAPVSIKPTYGKAASVSVKLVVKDVTDFSKLYTYFANRSEVQDLLRSLAQKELDAGRTAVPGITTAEEAKIR
jgi:hypothetical protein